MFINDLHFQVDQGILVKNYPDIKEKGLQDFVLCNLPVR